jgi:ATP-dependent 26S proteasome regulatory subunit
MATSTHAQFLRELRSLLRAPYALIHLQTFEEERALSIIGRLADADSRPVVSWSPVTDFDGNPSEGDILAAFDRIERGTEPTIFVLKDAHSFVSGASNTSCNNTTCSNTPSNTASSHTVRRRLREMEGPCAAAHKTVVLLGPEKLELHELRKDLAQINLPLPGREVIQRECALVFPAAEFKYVDHDGLVSGAMGLTSREAFRAFHRVRQQYEEALERNQPFDIAESILREKQRLIGASEILEFFPLDQGLGDVGGLDSLKRWLSERKRAFSEDAKTYGLPSPKGLLLIGVQGCGKSLTAKAVARHWGLPLLRLDLGVIFDGKRSPEDALRQAISTSEAIAPCVLWMDEIEKGFGGDGRSMRVLGSLLTWQQEKTAPVFLVATANDVTALPPEMLRKGRFDEIFFVDLPDRHERKEILEIHLTRRGRQFDDNVVDELAARSEHFSGAELEQVVVSAMYTAFANEREMTVEDLEFAVKETIPLYRTYEEEIKALREWAHGRARTASHERKVLDFFE